MNQHILTTRQLAEAVQLNSESVQQRVANLALLLLTDDNGVSEKCFYALMSLCRKVNGELAISLNKAVDATDGRWYIPESKLQGVLR